MGWGGGGGAVREGGGGGEGGADSDSCTFKFSRHVDMTVHSGKTHISLIVFDDRL